jgi:hypothetical protein
MEMDIDGGVIGQIRQVGVDIAEVYSPRRVTSQGEKMGLKAGEAMDLTTGWDFRLKEHRDCARKYIHKYKPKLLIGSPMCTAFSTLQRMNPNDKNKTAKWLEAKEHIKFVVELYREQVKGGRWFLHEHPAMASSWDLEEMKNMEKEEGVKISIADQCMYGLETWTAGGAMGKARKRTKFMTNCEGIHKELQKKCDGRTERRSILRQISFSEISCVSTSSVYQHQHLLGGRAKDAARYPEELCKAICRGLLEQMHCKELGVRYLYSVKAEDGVQENHGCEHEDDLGGQAWDDVSGEMLDPAKVQGARREEIQYVNDMKVWRKMSRREAIRRGYKIIKVRWIDINKGDKQHPLYRSRLVGKEFNDGVIEGLFASTPPLEALRLLVSDAATICEGQDKVLMINDISRAYFEAPMRRFLCVELPDEARDQKDYEEDNVGLLLMSLYGTRDAAANFQAEVNVFMKSCGFRRGRYNVSTYYHQEKNLKTLVHGDDFVTTGERKNTEWFRARLLSRFQIKTKVVGTGTSDLREATVLNRTIRTTATGWEYEADQRHADILVREMNLEEANSVKTPGEDAKPWWEDEDAEKLKGKEETKFRAMAARCNYLALDRADIQYPTKEICRGMANPSKGDVRKLRRLVRYLVERRRVVFVFEFQKYVSDLKGYSDSDWAGCRRTAKSTSGGVIMNGKHCIKTWASTQKNITLSSGEAELVQP